MTALTEGQLEDVSHSAASNLATVCSEQQSGDLSTDYNVFTVVHEGTWSLMSSGCVEGLKLKCCGSHKYES